MNIAQVVCIVCVFEPIITLLILYLGHAHYSL